MTAGPTLGWRPILLWGLASLVAAATVVSFIL